MYTLRQSTHPAARSLRQDKDRLSTEKRGKEILPNKPLESIANAPTQLSVHAACGGAYGGIMVPSRVLDS
jgi:hypothetical protein